LKARVKILSYRVEGASIGPVEFESLKLAGEKALEEPVELGDDVEGTLEKLAIELGIGDYVEAIAEARNSVIRVGVGKGERGSRQGSSLLFYRPSKLLKVGVVSASEETMGSLEIEEHHGSGEMGRALGRETEGERDSGETIAGIRAGLSEDDIVWYTPPDVLYIFEGQVVLRMPCEAVIFVTEDGEKIYTGPGETQGKRSVRRTEKRSRRSRKKKRK